MDVERPATDSSTNDNLTTGGPQTGGAVDVVRSEERLAVARSRLASGRVVVGKRVVTEERTVTVTVRREEFYLSETGVGDGQGGGAEAAATRTARRNTPRELTFVLREEVPVVTTNVVPYEEVTVAVERLVADVEVTGDVAREVVEVTKDGESRPVQSGPLG